MSRRLPSLNALRCFETVAAQLSIKKAAAALHISESAVSRQVRILEEQLGLSLFRRNPSGLEITEAGKALAASTRGAFDQIARTIDSFHRDQDTVQIKVLPTFALRWLYPRLRKFQVQHPLIRIVVQTRWHDMSSGDGEAELGVRIGLGNWPEDCGVELYPEWLIPVCAPDYLSGRSLATAEDFSSLTLLHPQPGRDDWKTWCSGWGGGTFDTDGGLDFDVLDMALRAAQAGHGLAITDVLLAHDAIEAGHLVTPLRRAVPSGVSYFLVKPPDLGERRQVRLFHEWICDEMSDSRRLIESYAH